jgi:hypothetical protein
MGIKLDNTNNMNLSERQLDYLTQYRDMNRDAVDNALTKLVEDRAKGPGHVVYNLRWTVDEIMKADILFANFQEILDMNADPETKATLDFLQKHYTRQIMQWSVPSSSGHGHRIQELMQFEALKKTYELINVLIDIGIDEAKLEVEA